MASTYLSRTPSSTGNRRTFTLSFWVKRTSIASGNKSTFSVGNSASSTSDANWFVLIFHGSTNTLRLTQYNTQLFNTNRLFRDTNGWMHIVIAVDTTQGTASDRLKLYVNGVQETSFSTINYPSQNYDFAVNNTVTHSIGREDENGSVYFDGLLSHYHFIDGTTYDADTFGETDSTTGIWKPKTAPSVTYGTNGFFLKFENSGSMGTDSSGNSNTFTVNGTMTQTIDTPSNVFATWNPLANFNNTLTFSKGNLTAIANSSSNPWFSARATLGFTSGKWFWETKFTGSTDPVPAYIGVVDESAALNIDNAHNANGNTLYYNGSGGEMRVDGSSTSNDYGNFSTSDVCGVAVNADDNLITIYKNGSAIITNYALSTTRTGFLFPTAAATNTSSGTNNNGLITNFGNGYFGTTAVSSAQNPDDGIGIFEYDVPAGYRALCTKSINAEEYN